MRIIDGKPWLGMHGPAVKPMALRALAEIAQMNLGAPIVARGGVHSSEDIANVSRPVQLPSK
jgi:dihydroorotate dehydrogenase